MKRAYLFPALMFIGWFAAEHTPAKTNNSRKEYLLCFSYDGKFIEDRGIVTYPAEGKQTAGGAKFVENTGVLPAILVTNRPDDYIRGIDRQLERSTKEILAQIKVE